MLSEHFDGNTTGVSRAGVGSKCQDRERQGVATELTGMYLQRVLAVSTQPGSPPPITQWDSSGLWGIDNMTGNSLICRLESTRLRIG